MPDELVAVYTTNDLSDAAIIRAALESEGIQAFIEGEGQAALTGVFPISVVVSAAAAERARDHIAQHESAKPADGDQTDAELEADELEYERLHPNADVEAEE